MFLSRDLYLNDICKDPFSNKVTFTSSQWILFFRGGGEAGGGHSTHYIPEVASFRANQQLGASLIGPFLAIPTATVLLRPSLLLLGLVQ